MTSTIDARKDAQKSGTYDVYIDIDCDCEELLDAIGLDYTTSEDDETQNEVKVVLNKDEFCDVFETCQLAKANEQEFSGRLLNWELAEYTTRVQVYTPQGNKITFE
jgi:hypothetical protein